jgi:circadian clock protein KaiC
MLAMEVLVRGAAQFNEPGVFVMFEESAEEITANVRSLGFDLESLVAEKKIVLDYVHIERSEIEETGDYDLEGLFIRLGYAIDSIGAKRVVLDTVEALFAGLPNHGVLRAELRRLFRWLKDRGITAIITGEKGDGNAITRYGLEEYVADCVIVLDQRIHAQISTRRAHRRLLLTLCAAFGQTTFVGMTGVFPQPRLYLSLADSALCLVTLGLDPRAHG